MPAASHGELAEIVEQLFADSDPALLQRIDALAQARGMRLADRPATVG
jgi:hypothetical protein